MQSALGLNLPIKQNVRIGCTSVPRRQVSTGPTGVAAMGKTKFQEGQCFVSIDLDTRDRYMDIVSLDLLGSSSSQCAMIRQRSMHVLATNV